MKLNFKNSRRVRLHTLRNFFEFSNCCFPRKIEEKRKKIDSLLTITYTQKKSHFLQIFMKASHRHLLIGAHTSAAGGAPNALLEGSEIGATTIQLFTSNQRQWKGRTIDEEEIALWKTTLQETGMQKVMSHSSYLINLGSFDSEIHHKSQVAFAEEIKRCHQLELSFLNFHPGTNTCGENVETCLDRIIASLKKYEKLCAQGSTRLLIETTAGQGHTVGHRFEHLAYLLDALKTYIPIGICIDTCHIFSAGYDIRTPEAWHKTLIEFDQCVGLKHLYALHLNDSKKPFASCCDRHANLGEGEIGLPCFKFIMTHPKLRDIPKYLETPDGPSRWKKEIELLRSFC